MNQIEIIRSINNASQENYVPEINKNEHDVYLENCNKYLFEFLKSYLGEGFLFSALTLKKESKKTFKIITGHDSETNYNFYDGATTSEKLAVKNLLDDASSGVTINLTQALLSKKPGQDLFFCAGTKKYDSGIVNGSTIIDFDLSELTFDADYNQFKQINVEGIKKFKDKLALSEEYEIDMYGKYLQHYKNIELKYKADNPDKNFYVHLIRPSIIDLDFNLLLSLATNVVLEQGQLAFINLLIYRIVSQTAIEKVLEAEKKAFSLTTHSFKTELNTTIIPQVNLIKKEIQKENSKEIENTLNKYVAELDVQCNDLKNLTGIITLIDKLDNESDFIESGKKDYLLTETLCSLSIEKHCKGYNNRNKSLPEINITGNAVKEPFNIKVFNHYLSETVIKLFFDNIYENITEHGKRKSNRLNLGVEKTNDKWVFRNELKVKTFSIDPKKLRGNLLFFKTIIEQSNSGSLEVKAEDGVFEIIYKSN